MNSLPWPNDRANVRDDAAHRCVRTRNPSPVLSPDVRNPIPIVWPKVSTILQPNSSGFKMVFMVLDLRKNTEIYGPMHRMHRKVIRLEAKCFL